MIPEPDRASVDRMWTEFVAATGSPTVLVDAFAFGDSAAMADELADLVVNEGEGDRTLESWRDGHRRYFVRECAQRGPKFTDDVLVVLERFEVVWPMALAAPTAG